MKISKILGIAILFLIPRISYAQIDQKTFRLNAIQKRIEIVKEPTNGVKLLVNMAFKEDWKGDAEAAKVLEMVRNQVSHLKDSFKSDLAQKKIFIEAFEDAEWIKAYTEESSPENKAFVYKDSTFLPLKSSKDSIFVIKHYGRYDKLLSLENDSMTSDRIVAYTFVVNDIKTLETEWNAVEKASSEINEFVVNSGNSRYFKSKERQIKVFSSFQVGMTYFNDRVGLTLDGGYGILFRKYAKISPFVMLNLGEIVNSKFPLNQSNAYTSLSLEFGAISPDNSFTSLSNKYSIGIGYLIGNKSGKNTYPNAQILPNMYRLYFNFPIDKKINFGWDMYTNLLKNENPRASALISLYLKYSF